MPALLSVKASSLAVVVVGAGDTSSGDLVGVYVRGDMSSKRFQRGMGLAQRAKEGKVQCSRRRAAALRRVAAPERTPAWTHGIHLAPDLHSSSY